MVSVLFIVSLSFSQCLSGDTQRNFWSWKILVCVNADRTSVSWLNPNFAKSQETLYRNVKLLCSKRIVGDFKIFCAFIDDEIILYRWLVSLQTFKSADLQSKNISECKLQNLGHCIRQMYRVIYRKDESAWALLLAESQPDSISRIKAEYTACFFYRWSMLFVENCYWGACFSV